MAFLVRGPALIYLTLATVGPTISYCQSTALGEYQVKAAFLYNFAKFIEWPPGAFKGPDEPINVCVLGQNPFGPALEDIVNGQKAAERGFRVRQISDSRDAAKCHLVFLSAGERTRERAFLEEAKTLPVLTVGERDGFLADGGIIVFTVRNMRIRFEIDADRASRARLKISSKLLNLAGTTK